MIALLPVGVEKSSDENLAERVDHAKASYLWQKRPVKVGLGATREFQFCSGRGGTVVR
jgi:hypothetical protein